MVTDGKDVQTDLVAEKLWGEILERTARFFPYFFYFLLFKQYFIIQFLIEIFSLKVFILYPGLTQGKGYLGAGRAKYFDIYTFLKISLFTYL